MPLNITQASRADLDLMIDWAAAEGWNPGLADAPVFFDADPKGYLIGRLGTEPVAAVSVVSYGAGFGFLGFYLCKPGFRGQGHGIAVWNAGMAQMAGRVVGLDGVVAQQDNYRKSGFVLAYRNVRHAGIAQAAGTRDPHIVEVSTEIAEQVVAYDRPLFPAPRESFTRDWLKPDRRKALAYVEDGIVRGYGVIRPCRTGHKIAPLFADTPAIAEALFAALTNTVAGEPVSIDLPEPNPDAVALAKRHGLASVFETARMYRGPAPELPLANTYGVTSFELG